MLFYALTGLLAGIVSGMGIGGGVIIIPVLTTFFGMSQIAAQNINLLYFAPTAAAAIIVHIKNKRIKAKLAAPIILFGVAAAAVGAVLALKTDTQTLKKAFGIFLILMGTAEIFKKN